MFETFPLNKYLFSESITMPIIIARLARAFALISLLGLVGAPASAA